MRLRLLITCVALVALPFGSSMAQSITLESVDGLYAPDTLPVGQTITFNLRVTNEASDHGGVANGFRVYSPEGATWTGISGDTLDVGIGWRTMFDLMFAINYFDNDGVGADTVGFGGIKLSSTGLPANFDAVAYAITIGPIDKSHHGKTIAFDSSFYPPTGSWKWAPSTYPSWDGPHVFTIFDPEYQPTNLVLTPSQLNFYATAGGANPAPLSFTVSEAGGQAISFTATETCAWFDLSDYSGTTDMDITVNVDIADLTAGTYVDTVTIASVDADNSPQYVEVTLQLTEAAIFVAVPDMLEFLATEGDGVLTPKPFNLSMSDASNVPYMASETSAWVSIEANASDVTPQDISVGADATGMTAGVYLDSILIEEVIGKLSPDQVAPIYVYVRLSVSAPARLLRVTPGQLEFTALVGGADPATRDFLVREEGGASILITATETAGWFDLSGFTSDVTPATITVAVHITGLAAGDYLDSVTIISGQADNSPIYGRVHLVLSDQPNNPPVITAIDDFFIDECGSISTTFYATDPDGDALALWMDTLYANMTFSDNGFGSGLFTFNPNFSQAGVYDMILLATDSRDTVSDTFSITVDECEPGTEGDTVTVATLPAVPGAQIMVPVSFANLCDVGELYVRIGWGSDYVTLDSASFAGSRIPSNMNPWAEIDNENNNVWISAVWSQVPSYIPPGSGNMVNLYFSLDPATPAGFYAIDLYNAPEDNGLNPRYVRDCGEGDEEVRPFFIPGGIVVDTTGNYVCGYVIDEDSIPIPGATVELWDDFPGGLIVDQTLSSGTGVFAFSDFTTIPFDLWAYKDGYYPGKVENINFAQSGIMIVLTPYDTVHPTQDFVDYYCDYNTYLGAPIPVGSVIDAYDPDDVRCGSFIVTEAGRYGFLHVYGDEPWNEGDQGAEPGDPIRFFVNGIEAITTGTAVWTEPRDILEVCLEVPGFVSHVCELVKGWNLVSWPLDTDTDDIVAVLSSIQEYLEVVMGFEQGGLTYEPNLPLFSDLWEVDHLSGYWIKVDSSVTLEIVGMPVPISTPIRVTAGWNLVSYLPAEPLATQVALGTIHDDLIVALGYDGTSGLTYVPGDDLYNDLLELSSCYGYWVKVHNDGSLVYPGKGPTLAPQSNRNIFASRPVSTSSNGVTPTTRWVNLYSHNLTVDGSSVLPGTEIAAFTMDGVKVGSFSMKDNGLFGFMPIYGDDPATDEVEGVTSGELFYLTVGGVKTEETFVWSKSGDKTEIGNLTAKATSEETLPVTYSLAQNYPNPFNPTTTISFTLPTAGKSKIEVFNLLGKVVAVPFDGMAKAGLNEVVWDGRNSRGQTVASGIYFYRLTSGSYSETKKMTLLK